MWMTSSHYAQLYGQQCTISLSIEWERLLLTLSILQSKESLFLFNEFVSPAVNSLHNIRSINLPTENQFMLALNKITYLTRRSMCARVLQAKAQFVLKIEKKSYVRGIPKYQKYSLRVGSHLGHKRERQRAKI